VVGFTVVQFAKGDALEDAEFIEMTIAGLSQVFRGKQDGLFGVAFEHNCSARPF
jgi:hypothetical protein